MMIPQAGNLMTFAHALVVDFPLDNIPILQSEEQWREWGNWLIQENSFSRSGAPNTKNYANWLDWAKDVYHAMANF